MKTRKYIFVIALFLCTTVGAQPRLAKPEMFIGVYGGASLSTVFFTPSAGTMSDFIHWPLAPAGGLVFRYGGHRVCSFQLELGYAQRGWHEYMASNYDYTRKLDYITMPILSHIHFGGNNFQAFFNLGPEIGYCIRSSEFGTKQPDNASTYQYRAIDHPFDWGVAGGLGVYGIAHNVGVFQLEARAHYSFGSLYNNTRAEHFAASNMFYLSLNLAYLWQIK